MIFNFADKDTQRLFDGEQPRRFGANIRRRMIDKLQMLHAAAELEDLRLPAGNRLETLSGGRRGQYSIRINDQWRICFRWEAGNAVQVEIVDYH